MYHQPVMILHESDGEHYSSYQSTFYEETEGTASICESPVRNEKYFKPPVQCISPGKLKKLIQNQQAEVLFQIECTEQQIIENTPSKNSFSDNKFIQMMKVKRMESRQMASKFDDQPKKEEAMTIIDKLRKGIYNNKA